MLKLLYIWGFKKVFTLKLLYKYNYLISGNTDWHNVSKQVLFYSQEDKYLILFLYFSQN